MEDSPAVAVADSIQNLEEDTLGESIIPNVLFAVGDVVEEVPFRTVLKDNIYAVRVVDNALHGDDVRVVLRLPMCPDFPSLELHGAMVLWASIGSNPVECLDRALTLGQQVDSPVNDAVCSGSQDIY